MTIKRHRSPQTITTVPRSTLASVHHKEIDAILKTLKVCSRRLKSTLDNFNDELRTLERLYYKGKNQHRMALFFKRVPEMRRYGRRLSELDILQRVDLLRAAFVGLEHTNDQKALRASWNHVPESPYVRFLVERLMACSTLVCKMRERLENAFHHFALAMQTGAFIQLIVLFAAISSRMSVLSSELEKVLQLSISTCNRLLVVIDPIGTQATTPQQLESEMGALHPSHMDFVVQSKDTGQPISRCEPVDTPTPAVNVIIETELEIEVKPPSSYPTDVDEQTIGSKKIAAKTARKSRPKKSKKFDEIDEIFGF